MLMDLWVLFLRWRQYQFYNSFIFIHNKGEAALLLVGETHPKNLLHVTGQYKVGTIVYFPLLLTQFSRVFLLMRFSARTRITNTKQGVDTDSLPCKVFLFLLFFFTFLLLLHTQKNFTNTNTCKVITQQGEKYKQATYISGYHLRNPSSLDSLNRRPASKNPAKIMCYLSRKPSLPRA